MLTRALILMSAFLACLEAHCACLWPGAAEVCRLIKRYASSSTRGSILLACVSGLSFTCARCVTRPFHHSCQMLTRALTLRSGPLACLEAQNSFCACFWPGAAKPVDSSRGTPHRRQEDRPCMHVCQAFLFKCVTFSRARWSLTLATCFMSLRGVLLTCHPSMHAWVSQELQAGPPILTEAGVCMCECHPKHVCMRARHARMRTALTASGGLLACASSRVFVTRQACCSSLALTPFQPTRQVRCWRARARPQEKLRTQVPHSSSSCSDFRGSISCIACACFLISLMRCFVSKYPWQAEVCMPFLPRPNLLTRVLSHLS